VLVCLAEHVDKPTISPVIPRIGRQIRLSLILAKASADLQALIFQSCPAGAILVDETRRAATPSTRWPRTPVALRPVTQVLG